MHAPKTPTPLVSAETQPHWEGDNVFGNAPQSHMAASGSNRPGLAAVVQADSREEYKLPRGWGAQSAGRARRLRAGQVHTPTRAPTWYLVSWPSPSGTQPGPGSSQPLGSPEGRAAARSGEARVEVTSGPGRNLGPRAGAPGCKALQEQRGAGRPSSCREQPSPKCPSPCPPHGDSGSPGA